MGDKEIAEIEVEVLNQILAALNAPEALTTIQKAGIIQALQQATIVESDDHADVVEED